MDEELLASHRDAISAARREEFIGERDRRVRELRAAGHRDEAAALEAHRKPTVVAWAVNQLAHQHPDQVSEALAVAQRLRGAQRRAASGQGSDGLREASRELRVLVSGLAQRAGETLEGTGVRPDSHLDGIEQTLFAAVTDASHHHALQHGWLTTTIQAAGFGEVDWLVAVPTPDDRDGAGPDEPHEVAVPQPGPKEADEQAQRREQARRSEARRQDLARQMAQVQRTHDRQQRRVERANTKARELRQRADEAAADLATLRTELDRLAGQLADLVGQITEVDP